MPEVAHPGEYHGEPQPIRRGDYLFIAHRSSRLDHRCDALLGRLFHTVGKLGGGNCPLTALLLD